mmetsp:Transcript_54579/g.153272  ORF Transcript_54579/g.153272 Transcript_54579/m.153272 type:complete len:330 (-) Transcript_54579:352-1341(-)
MGDHSEEEGAVKVRQEGAEPAAEAPEHRHGRVRGVVNLARLAIPTIDQQHADITLDVLRLLHVAEGGEQVTCEQLPAPLLHLEVALVVVRLVPDPVRRDEQDTQHAVVHHAGDRRKHQPGPSVVCEEKRVVAIEQRHASEVPPAEHPTELLSGNVPRVRNEVLTLGARVTVQAVSQHHKRARVAPSAQAPVRLDVRADCAQEQQSPRQTCLRDHLDVHHADPGVQARPDEEVVDARDLATLGVAEVAHDRVDVSERHRRDEECGVLLDENRQVEDVSDVQHQGACQRRVEARVGVAQVAQARRTCDGHTGHHECEGVLREVVAQEPAQR